VIQMECEVESGGGGDVELKGGGEGGRRGGGGVKIEGSVRRNCGEGRGLNNPGGGENTDGRRGEKGRMDTGKGMETGDN